MLAGNSYFKTALVVAQTAELEVCRKSLAAMKISHRDRSRSASRVGYPRGNHGCPRCNAAAKKIQAVWKGYRTRQLFYRWLSLTRVRGFVEANPIEEFMAHVPLNH